MAFNRSNLHNSSLGHLVCKQIESECVKLTTTNDKEKGYLIFCKHTQLTLIIF